MTLITNQPYAAKPLINRKVSLNKNLTIQDLNFIYERTSEYELDQEMKNEIEEYRVKNNLPINPKYTAEVKCNLIENPNRKNLF